MRIFLRSLMLVIRRGKLNDPRYRLTRNLVAVVLCCHNNNSARVNNRMEDRSYVHQACLRPLVRR